MENLERARQRCLESLQKGVVRGHFAFIRDGRPTGIHTNSWIPLEIFQQQKTRWATLAVETIVQESSAGVIGRVGEPVYRMMQHIGTVLKGRGMELPWTELTRGGEYLSGYPLTNYQPGAEVTIIEEITTLGDNILELKDMVQGRGLVVKRVVSLVDRSNTESGYKLMATAPFKPVVHFPLPSYWNQAACPMCTNSIRVHQPFLIG